MCVGVAMSSFGGILTSLSDSGLQHLCAGARANVGVKSGRYMYQAMGYGLEMIGGPTHVLSDIA